VLTLPIFIFFESFEHNSRSRLPFL
jgi:hypothetical protein